MISCFHLCIPHPGGAAFLLEDATFEVEAGSWTEFIGPSGCGKSALFSIFSLRAAPLKGKVLLGGRNLDRLKGAGVAHLRREIGSCAQQVTLLPGRTVIENLVLPYVVRGMSSDVVGYAEEALEAVDRTSLRDQCVDHLSDQDRRVVGVLRAMIGGPRLVVIDGGLEGLETSMRARLAAILQASRGGESTVLLLGRAPCVERPADARLCRFVEGNIEPVLDVHDQIRGAV